MEGHAQQEIQTIDKVEFFIVALLSAEMRPRFYVMPARQTPNTATGSYPGPNAISILWK